MLPGCKMKDGQNVSWSGDQEQIKDPQQDEPTDIKEIDEKCGATVRDKAEQ